MHRDVVEIAETILKAFHRDVERFSALARKDRRKKLGGVAHLLSLNSQLVAAGGAKRRKFFAALFYLLPAPFQLRRGKFLNGHIATFLDEVVAWFSPIAVFKPNHDIQR